MREGLLSDDAELGIYPLNQGKGTGILISGPPIGIQLGGKKS